MEICIYLYLKLVCIFHCISSFNLISYSLVIRKFCIITFCLLSILHLKSNVFIHVTYIPSKMTNYLQGVHKVLVAKDLAVNGAPLSAALRQLPQ